MFTRQDVCALTGIPVAAFKTRARRNQLPTVVANGAFNNAPEDIRDHAKERGWNWFSPIDVLLIAVQQRLMMEIGYSDGYGADTAANVVTKNASEIGRIYWLASPTIDKPSPHDLWVGYVGFTDHEGRASGGREIGGHIEGILSSIAADGDRQKARLGIVNVSAVLRDVRNNAARCNISFPVPADWR
jgi:hypothetical protein